MSTLDQQKTKLPQLFRCHFNDCTRVFKRKDRLDIHLRVHTGERPFVCEVEGCRKSYSRSQHLSRHVENVHRLLQKDSPTFSCPVCRRELANIHCLQNHMKAEHEEKVGPKRYECPEKDCSESFHKKKQLISHRLQEHTDHILEARKCHRCPHEGCDKTFNWMNLLKRHMKVHQGYPCNTEGCGKVLPNWSSLRKHIAEDHAKVFSCDECGIKFSRKPNLTQHMKRKHQGPKEIFICTVEGCGRKYDYKSNLALHIREAHEGESIWKNRQRIRKKPVKKSGKKITFAAKLCGLDDRGEVLKLLKTRGKKTNKPGNDLCVDKQQTVANPRMEVNDEIMKGHERGELVASEDLLSSEERQQAKHQPLHTAPSNSLQPHEVESGLEMEFSDHEEFKRNISMDHSFAEITMIR